ncbi:MAG: hypothetical protein JXR88_07350 [Clostridia bacterium]|nr:hypothetical protein [Clostridia bacterium]
MKKLFVLLILLFALIGCEEEKPLKIFGVDEEKIVEASELTTGFSYRFVTEYTSENESAGVMEVMIRTDEAYEITEVTFNPIAANKLHQTMNPKDESSVYGLLTIQLDPEVTYSVVSEQALLDYYKANSFYDVISNEETDHNQVSIELKANESKNVIVSYTFEINEDHKGILTLN